MTTKKRNLHFKIILVLFPLVIFCILEISLRLLGYGNKSKLFFTPKYLPALYLENVAGYNKYVDKKIQVHADKIENHIRNVMTVKKGNGSLRGIVLGESAAQGFPYNSNHSFSKMMEVALIKTRKYSEVEILNLGVSAISSYSVRDIAKKALAYDPDFLILYGGNNEYYGTHSHITGGNHFTRNLYMKLYELRLFQLVKDFIALFHKKPEKPDQYNMMKEVFKQVHIPKNKETDEEIASNFIKNMEAIVHMYSKKNIPVIVVEPVCNLVDMAPFKGEHDGQIQNHLLTLNRFIQNKEIHKADSALFALKEKYNHNANLYFLEAQLEKLKTGKINLDQYILAKNHDIVPFRPREEIVGGIKKFYENKKAAYSNLFFVPLKEILTNQHGDSILGNSIFIDHVHFNQHGHKLTAGSISSELARILNLEANFVDSVHRFFNDEASVMKYVYSLPMYRFHANKIINNLIKQPPFNEMVFPYAYDQKELKQAMNELGMELVKKIYPLDPYDSFNETVMHYVENQNYDNAHEYALADRFLFPGSYYRYQNLGKFLQMFENFAEDAESAFTHAFLLSEKKPEIFRQIMTFYNETNQHEKAKEFREKYGKPRN